MRPSLSYAIALSSLMCPLACAQQVSPSPVPLTPAATAAPAQTAPAQNAAPAPAGPLSTAVLLDGTPVKLRLTENLTSATAKAGQQVSFEVVEEVDVDGVPVIPKLAKALATVTDAYPKKNMGRGGKLDVNVDSVRLVDGEKAQLRAVQEAKGGGHVGAMTGAIVATSIVFFPAAPLFLFVKGKDIVIPEGTVVTAFVQGDMKLNMNAMVPHDALLQAKSAAPDASPTLTVNSSQPGADIEIDGQFVGSTPSPVSVAPGQHTIVIKKKGYAAWTRSMMVSGSGAQITAELEPLAGAK